MHGNMVGKSRAQIGGNGTGQSRIADLEVDIGWNSILAGCTILMLTILLCVFPLTHKNEKKGRRQRQSTRPCVSSSKMHEAE